MKAEELLFFFRRGFIPGPNESEETFLKRAISRPQLSLCEWKEISHPLLEQWGFSIDWIPISYSSTKLLPWEGAVFWAKEDGTSSIQLKAYSTEILMHEAIHAAREAFDEPVFEEFLAYMTSTAAWKRWVGPMFQRVWEFPFFALAVFFIPFFPVVASITLAYFIGRLLYRHFFFCRIKKQVPLSVLLCLTDREIRSGKISQTSSLRLQLIEALFDVEDLIPNLLS